jgi:rhodanese-related sulfurtransferase
LAQQQLELSYDRQVLAICLSAHRSISAVRALKELGFDALQLEGGMQSWRAAGLPEVRPEKSHDTEPDEAQTENA